MKPGLLCLLLLSACTAFDDPYDYALTWICQSPEGCERLEEVELIDRLVTFGDSDSFKFQSTIQPTYLEYAQRVASDTVPPGCYLLYSFTIFGHYLEPSKLCRAPDGYDLELSIPNRNPATSSQWLVEIRDL